MDPQAPAVAKTSSFTPALRSADPVVGSTGRATLRMPKVTMMAAAKKSVKDLGASALKGKKVLALRLPAPERTSAGDLAVAARSLPQAVTCTVLCGDRVPAPSTTAC